MVLRQTFMQDRSLIINYELISRMEIFRDNYINNKDFTNLIFSLQRN